jgi:predicted ATPase/tRNA A-37 threonylcarbamoyl transferase component Bud32
VPDLSFTLPADRYRIERQLGRGGMATVYLAYDVRHARQVAVKVLNPEISAGIGRDRFLREIVIAARLNHPHIVPLFDSGEACDRLYYVMPYIAGESLRTRLARVGQLPPDDALRLAREIASALGHAHQQELVHRDIKPENVLLVEDMALVADFGIARSTGAVASSDATQLTTIAGAVFGTPQYMSPEQAMGLEVDPRSDIYSLACVLFEMLAGRPPFVAPTIDALLRMHMTVEPPRVTECVPSIPPGVAHLIARGLAKRPADRFATAAHFAEALAAAVSQPTPAAFALTGVGEEALNNLPRPRTRFVGREKELAECVRLLRDAPMLTLTGIGGGGKTRLAIRAVEHVVHQFPDGVWFADLAPVHDGGRVLETIAAVLDVREAAAKDLGSSLDERLRGKRLLLILDNCEHLLSNVADAADRVLAAGRGIQILATSREAVGIEGERIMTVGPLAAPPVTARDPSAIAASDAVQLFVDRARQLVREFAVNDGNARAVADICRRLDGIPLAIELAAARVKVLSVEQIRDRLDDRFRLLTGGSRSALPRHQTLQATIQWSYDQLAADEQQLLRRLSVFAGGWTLESSAAVCSEHADEFEVLDLLSRLADKSLVIVVRHETTDPRYSLLETVRQYAAERLIATDDAAAVRRRHADVFMALAEQAYDGRIVAEGRWSAVLEREHDNLRTALSVLREIDPEGHLQLAGALAWFWQARSYLLEGREHVTSALAATSAAPSRRARARALWGAASLLAWQGDAAASQRCMEDALHMWREVGDPNEIAPALEGLGWAQFLAGDDHQARATFEECLSLQRASGDLHLVNRAAVALAQVLVALDKVDEARRFAAEIIAFSQAHGERRSEHSGWHYLADCALLEEKCEEALGLYQKSLRLASEIGDRIEIGFEVQGVAMSLAGLGHAETALWLAASVEAEMERLGAGFRVRFWDALLDRYLGRARLALGLPAADAWARGRAIGFDDAVAQALSSS